MSANNNSNNTLLMPHQDGDGIFPKSNARKAIPKVKPKAKPKAQASSSSGKKESKKIVHLSPVESLLFFNIIRFNTNPNTIDWEKVALHSNLKNACSAKVRFRQTQQKYQLEPQPTSIDLRGKRKASAVVAVAEDEYDEDDEDADIEDGVNIPSKKHVKTFGTPELAYRTRASQMNPVGHGGFDHPEVSGATFAAANNSVFDPFTAAQQSQDEQQVQDQSGSAIKHEFPFHEAQMMDNSPAHPNGRSNFNANAHAYNNVGPTQRSGRGMSRARYNPRSPYMSTHEQQAHHRDLEQQYMQQQQQRAQSVQSVQNAQWGGYMSPYGQSEPQAQMQTYMNQPVDGQYGHFGVLPAYSPYTQTPQPYFGYQSRDGSQAPQPYFNTQGQAGSPGPGAYMGALDQVDIQALTQAPAQDSALDPILMGDGTSSSSLGDAFMLSVAASPTQMSKPASQSSAYQGGEEVPAIKKANQSKSD